MISQLHGRLLHIDLHYLVIDVHGVGYQLFATGRTLTQIGTIGDEVRLHTSLIVREDALTLYGFADRPEREAFGLLQTVQGVGAKAALAILTALTPHELLQAILAGDKAMISRADGIGPKLALRIMHELAQKTDALVGETLPTSIHAGGAGDAGGEINPVLQDALSALGNLGYARTETFSVVTQYIAAHPQADLAAIIAGTLKILGSKSPAHRG